MNGRTMVVEEFRLSVTGATEACMEGSAIRTAWPILLLFF